MYIDGLTITALVVFAIALGVFIKHCLVENCETAGQRLTEHFTRRDQ